MNLLNAALTYASWGWHVLPVKQGEKIPACEHGVKEATCDPEQIKRWWAKNPAYNIGIAAGIRSGLVVFDIDPRNTGDQSWEEWCTQNGDPPDTHALQLTAGGGQHHLARYHPEFRSCKLAPGIDLLSEGRYFLVAPSVVEGRGYHWELESHPGKGIGPFAIPERWVDAYRSLKTPTLERKEDPGALLLGNRNAGLTAMAGMMRRYGMSGAEILAAISVSNETRCERPLPSSEVLQIARSVQRYTPTTDIADNAARGEESAIALTEIITPDYFFVRATSFFSQPSPPRWAIRKWLPLNGLSMIYGESGAGKTFVAIDMACAIATGKDWQGHKTIKGVVAYLAGEGHYGLQSRIVSWGKAHQIEEMDTLLVSNKAIDIDSGFASQKILRAIHELTKEPLGCVFIDTLNNHMAGDENSAKDTRALIATCAVVSAALHCSVCLIHHTGHLSKDRARGSSAIKASLDAMILVERSEEQMTITCTKLKDAIPPAPMLGHLLSVDLGWIDEEGEGIKGAVFESTPERAIKRPPEVIEAAKILEAAWWASKREIRAEVPYLSNLAIDSYLLQGKRRSSVVKKLLIDHFIMSPTDGGVQIIDPALSTALLLRNNA